MTRLVEVRDELDALPDDALADRAALRTEQHELRATLATLQAENHAAILDEWSNQASRKSARNVPSDVRGFDVIERDTAGGMGGP